MFPIYIGINRDCRINANCNGCVPYIHRDKPNGFLGRGKWTLVFPIYIGINRHGKTQIINWDRVPYIHRDKPGSQKVLEYVRMCSLYT